MAEHRINSDPGADPRIVRLSIGVEEAEVSAEFHPLASELTIISFQGSQAGPTPGSAEVNKGMFLPGITWDALLKKLSIR